MKDIIEAKIVKALSEQCLHDPNGDAEELAAFEYWAGHVHALSEVLELIKEANSNTNEPQ